MPKLSQKPGFLDQAHENSETGFLRKIWWGCQNYRRNPVSWIRRAGFRNRVSYQNLV